MKLCINLPTKVCKNKHYIIMIIIIIIIIIVICQTTKFSICETKKINMSKGSEQINSNNKTDQFRVITGYPIMGKDNT